MHGLTEIIAMNNRATEKVEDNHNRHCSWTGSVADGIVLHSAKLRNTVFLAPAKAAKFVTRLRKAKTGIERDHLIESYFS